MTPQKEVPMAKDKFLAVAFTDLDGNHHFNANKDALMAAVVDTNHDKTVSIGDTVQFGTYPLHVDGTAGTGSFTHADSTVTSVSDATPTFVEVGVMEGSLTWGHSPGADAFQSSIDSNMGTIIEVAIGDIFTSTKGDSIVANPGLGGPAAPDTAVSDSHLQPGDQPFLDVFIA
jgi:hypothetical protein